MSFLPTRDYSISRPTSFVERSSYRDSHKTLGEEPKEPKVEPKVEAKVEPEPKSSGWREHVKSTYATLKAQDPSTTFKKAMTHAKASYKSKK